MIILSKEKFAFDCTVYASIVIHTYSIESLINAPTLEITDITNTSAEVNWNVSGCSSNYLEFEVLKESSIVRSTRIRGMPAL